MKGFRVSITQQYFQSCDLMSINHSCGILPLAQACPKMPCVYTSKNSFMFSCHADVIFTVNQSTEIFVVLY